MGRTADNPHLPPDYLESLLTEYPANLVAAYTEGEFVNMQQAAVYPEFSRSLNQSDVTKPDQDDILWIGIDFNVERCWMVVVIDRVGIKHVVAEHIARDTPALIETLNYHYSLWKDAGQLILCPDASSKARKTTNVGISDMGMLKGAGFRIQSQSANPLIKDRVLSLNAQILNGAGERKLLVNPACRGVLRGLEQHAYDLHTQQPVKGDGGVDDLSGQMDALGYAIWQLAGIKPYTTGSSRTVKIW